MKKKPEMRPKECVFDSHSGPIIMEYLPAHNHLFFVAYAAPKTFVFAVNIDFHSLLVKN